MKTIVDIINGDVSPRDIIESIMASNRCPRSIEERSILLQKIEFACYKRYHDFDKFTVDNQWGENTTVGKWILTGALE